MPFTAPPSARSTIAGSRTATSAAKSPSWTAARNASTTRRCFRRSASEVGAWPWTRRRARLASWRAATDERSTIGAPCPVRIAGRRCRRRNRGRSTQITRSSTRPKASRSGFRWGCPTPRGRCRCGTERPTSRMGRICPKAQPGTPCTRQRAWRPRSRWRHGSRRPGWAARWRYERPRSTGDQF